MLIFSTDTFRLLPDAPMDFQEETQVCQKYIQAPMALGNTTAYHVLYMYIQNYSTLEMLKYCAKRTTIFQFVDVKRIRLKVKQHKHKARWAGVSKSPSGGLILHLTQSQIERMNRAKFWQRYHAALGYNTRKQLAKCRRYNLFRVDKTSHAKAKSKGPQCPLCQVWSRLLSSCFANSFIIHHFSKYIISKSLKRYHTLFSIQFQLFGFLYFCHILPSNL